MKRANLIEMEGQGRRERESDEPTFEAFFGSHYPRLVRALLFSAGDLSEAEEAAQEAMVRVYERWSRVSGLDSPMGYAYVVGANWIRRRRRRRWLSLKADVPDSSRDPFADFEIRDRLLTDLSRLTPGARDALLLVAFLGLDAKEAADVLGIDPASVRSRVHRARAALRAIEED